MGLQDSGLKLRVEFHIGDGFSSRLGKRSWEL